MLIALARHRTDHRQLVGAVGDVGKQIAGRDAALTMPTELERRRKDISIAVEHHALNLHRHRFALNRLYSHRGND